ncbi:2-dehydropantoate 2-reductase [Deinobacterium chartae]|uniref:2-dehydropantoate 2-reductase n=1 Tax=Deinobacterium chartae TaxID=521158 RepID=A0A841I177_9DEIO|nr:2-dehydropantoate 2-reductase [Deinobacterium chartae]
MNRYDVAVIGPGALGRVFAAALAPVCRVLLVARSAQGARDLEAGYRLGDHRVRPDVAFPPRLPTARWVIVLVKGPDTAAALEAARALGPSGILSLQNGDLEGCFQPLPGQRLEDQGVTTEAAYRDGNHTVWTARGETLLPEAFAELAELLRRAGLRARTEPQLRRERQRKLLVNVVINPVTALARRENGALLESPLRELAERLTLEALPALPALDLTPQAALERVFAVAQLTAANRSSMLADVLAGRLTERETLTGALLRRADALGLEVPAHRSVHALLGGLEGARAGHART